MICCFMNFHERENAKDLKRHLDREIEIAVGRGCTMFLTGNRYPEDEIFAERVLNAARFYASGEISVKSISVDTDKALKDCFISLADWEIYPYCEN